MKLFFTIFLLLISTLLYGQNWYTIAGSNSKNGLTSLTGPVSISTPYWSVTSPTNTVWGNAVYTFGDKFVSSRGVLSPYKMLVEMRSLATGQLIWSKTVSDIARLYTVGFTEDAVYAADYQGATTTLYALSVDSGNVKWSIATSMFPVNTGICFAPDGDPIIFGKRLDRKTGVPKWSYNYIIPVSPDGGFVVYGNTYYHWTGSIVTPKKLIAVDINTGALKYMSAELPGDGDQENDLVIGPDGTIYIARDGGALYAFTDNGSGFTEKWSKSPAVLPKSFGPNNVIYCANVNTGTTGGTLMRINALTGAVIDSMPGTKAVYVTVGADSTVYVNNGEGATGKLIAFTPDLQTIKWQLDLASVTYLGAPLGKEGVFVAIGAGTQITAYKPTLTRKPVADFRSSGRDINISQQLNFYDQSSYMPTSWSWTFTGGNPSTSNLQNPTGISYSTPGVYEVNLAVANSFGSDTITKTSYVVVTNTSGITQTGNEIPEKYFLGQNYPNPFNPVTRIEFKVSSFKFVKLTVFDILGKEVATLVNENLQPGTYQTNFDAGNLKSGIYFYKLSTSEFSDVKKMILLK